MKLHRIYGVVLRYMYFLFHSLDRVSDMFYWPTMDLVLWGITSSYLRSFSPTGAAQITAFIVAGILFWIITWRGQYEITVNLLDDLWNKNLINLFASPLTFWEWISAFTIVGIVKAIVSFTFATGVAYLLYRVQIFYFGWYFLPFFGLLIMTGWWIGFFVAGTILRFGTKIQTLAWTAAMIISPFSAIYYPLSVLPPWAQAIAKVIPTSYMFEGMREIIQTGNMDMGNFYVSLGLNLVYLAAGLVFVRKSFNKVLAKGLVKVY